MNIPSQIKIGGIKYKVKIVGEDDITERAAGTISTEKCLMKILKGDSQFMQVTFWHEIFHAINMEFEEETIEFLAQAMYQILTDNPQLLRGGATDGRDK